MATRVAGAEGGLMTTEHPGGPGGLRRRDFLRRSATVGAVAAAGPTVLTSCFAADRPGKKDADNPLGVRGSAPLEVVVHDGLYGEVYAEAHQDIYRRQFPDAEVTHAAVADIEAALETRFVGAEPPDVVDDSGAGAISLRRLVDQRQVTELADLLDAPSVDMPGKTVRQTLLAGALAPGTFGRRVYALPYAVTAWGLWYDASAFRANGWEYPRTWNDLLAFCDEVKGDGDVAPFVWPGTSPAYLRYPLHAMAFRIGGEDVWRAVDNLEPNAWRNDAIRQAVEAWYALAQKDYVLPGAGGLSPASARKRWLEGKAALLPAGSSLELQAGKDVPEGFEMTIAPLPSVTAADKVPFDALTVLTGKPFVVPKQAKNVAGGLEYLRIMCSVEGAKRFAEHTRTLTPVAGAHDDQNLGSAFTSVREAVRKAHTLPLVPNPRYPEWYGALAAAVDATLGLLMARKVDPAEAVDRIQGKADEVAEDSKVTKRRR